MARQDLSKLQQMCVDYSKVQPKEWPEGLIGVGPDMRNWVKAQDAVTIVKPKKSSGDNGNKQKSKSIKKSDE